MGFFRGYLEKDSIFLLFKINHQKKTIIDSWCDQSIHYKYNGSVDRKIISMF